jgi:hypothetical protein
MHSNQCHEISDTDTVQSLSILDVKHGPIQQNCSPSTYVSLYAVMVASILCTVIWFTADDAFYQIGRKIDFFGSRRSEASKLSLLESLQNQGGNHSTV